VSRVLAEPTLVAISGESASFLAGGEIPIVINSCAGGSGGSVGICTPTVTYKPYGVSLSFTPIVLSEGRISLRVATEVSEIDRDNQDAVTRSPGFRTRKQTTTVELPSGGTMVTAGLISSQSNQSIQGVPGLINLPILGALFRSRDFQRRDSELMIMVTPFIAKPMESAQAVRPDDGFQDATDPQTILLGRLNKLYGVAGPGGGRGLSGRYGFITD
jgi:pilus assembly protein CpaC